MIYGGSCDTVDWRNDAENSQEKNSFFEYCKISFFFLIFAVLLCFDQINAVLVSIKHYKF